MGKFDSDTVDEFIGKMIEHLIEGHDPSTDGESTGAAISLYRQLKDRVNEGISYNSKRGMRIARVMVEVAGDHDQIDDMDRLEELAAEVNSWS